MIDKLRKAVKDVATRVVKALESPGPPDGDDVPDVLLDDALDDVVLPSWKTEIIEHPQYWIETNYTEAAPDSPQTKATDVMRTVHREAVLMMFNTLRIQLKHGVRPEDGEWRGWVRDDVLHVEMKIKSNRAVPNMETAVGAAVDTIRTHGIRFEGFPMKVDLKAKQASIDLPISSVELAIEAPLVWMVLQRNRAKPIVWQGKLWLPKQERYGHAT
jgi:hypothetical protein